MRRMFGVLFCLVLGIGVALGAAASAYPMTLVSMDEAGNRYELVLSEEPVRVYSNNDGTTEMLLKLGLKDRIVGVGMLASTLDPAVEEDYNALPKLSEGYVSKEQLLAAEPDLVIGRAAYYCDAEGWGLGTIPDLMALGIPAYSQKATLPGATFDDLIEDIRDIGAMFNVQAAADAQADELLARMAALSEKTATAEQKTYLIVSAFDGNQFTVFGVSDTSMHNDALNRMNLQNPAAVTANVSAEQIIAWNPDLILFLDYVGLDKPAQEFCDDILTDPALQAVSAVGEGRVHPINFTGFLQYNYRLLDALEQIEQMAFGA